MKKSSKNATMDADKVFSLMYDEVSLKYYGRPYDFLQLGERKMIEDYVYDMNHPEWKQIIIDDVATGYEVNKLGDVRDINTQRVRTHQISQYGYPFTIIVYGNDNEYRKMVLIHRAVAEAFIPNPENKPQVNHIDGIKTHCYWRNLEWATVKENIDHAYNTGLHKRGSNSSLAKHTEEEVHRVCKLLEAGWRPVDIANKLGVDQRFVNNIVNKDAWMHISKNYKIPDPKQKRVISDEAVHEVCRRLANGEKYNEIANAMEGTGVSRQMVRAVAIGKYHREISDQYQIPGLTPSYMEEPKTMTGRVNRMFDNGVPIDTPTSELLKMVDLEPTNSNKTLIRLIRRTYKLKHPELG